MPSAKIEDIQLNKLMGNYFKVALNYLLLLPIDPKYSHLGFSQLPDKVRQDLIDKTIKFMAQPSELLFKKSPLELALVDEIDLLEKYLRGMAETKGKMS